jgi:hypothetical protein
MLDDNELDKLCHGRIVFAEVYDSTNAKPAGPHYAVILDSDDQVKKTNRFKVVVISHNTVIDPHFVMPVPEWTGLSGFIVGSWTTVVHEPGIQKIGHKMKPPEMVKILTLVRRADAARE